MKTIVQRRVNLAILRRGWLGCGLFLMLCAAAAPQALACRCSLGLSERAAYQRAHVVVVGRVDKVAPHADQNGSTATLTVTQGWKKRVSHEIQVETSTDCAFQFSDGQEYLLYLYDEPNGGFYTSECVGNAQLLHAGHPLDWLKRHGTPAIVD
jgi:hypothetical protein